MTTQNDLDPRAVGARPDFTIDQDWNAYSEEDHAVWRTLYRRQETMLPGRAADAFLKGLDRLDLGHDGVPHFEALSDRLERLTGWRIVAVPCLVPDAVFFEHLANRRFPAGRFMRRREELDYLQEPDAFHDVFGHVPMLADPVFADYMQAYGQGGLRALGLDCLKNLAALYWYTVEFGLIRTPEGRRIYGAGIVSSYAESLFALDDPSPHRVHFDLERVMSTDYRIDDFQQTYFVIDSFEELFQATVETDFGDLYTRLIGRKLHAPDALLPTDEVRSLGTQAYARAGGRFAKKAQAPAV